MTAAPTHAPRAASSQGADGAAETIMLGMAAVVAELCNTYFRILGDADGVCTRGACMMEAAIDAAYGALRREFAALGLQVQGSALHDDADLVQIVDALRHGDVHDARFLMREIITSRAPVLVLPEIEADRLVNAFGDILPGGQVHWVPSRSGVAGAVQASAAPLPQPGMPPILLICDAPTYAEAFAGVETQLAAHRAHLAGGSVAMAGREVAP